MALARNPKLLILDEPANGLDPAGIEEVRELLIELAAQGITVMVSSHLLDEVDKTATMLGIIDRGRLIFQGSREELLGQSIPDLILETEVERIPELPLPNARQLTDTTVSVPNLSRENVAWLLGQMAALNVPIFEARRAQQSLEEVFMDLTVQGSL